ncbi:hypothetical protein P7M46_03380 [Bisgaard Taxon 10/6]|uniref:ATP synthase F0 subunit 6 n=1 Tax=Exercitatus varius TaxID=67857 RepID=A0AAW6QC94_9PAST|nr:hypothetical protein [Exercitatus varius]QOF67518.1 hypothetical protein IFE17_10420 [Actinobacillus sp. GY-402]MDG2917055.1 hypothetical protein [Exercitatus varius]MDG2939216.1 hypothetical protein [Exercitatus varius]MDG2942254.1 hypothetical protein [Exercitatus varius]MDG2946354.1 hypothetical protein [Exercitatus varius]
MKLKDLIQPPPSETYVKNSSPLVTALLIIAGLLWYVTQYGSIIALVLALFVLMGQKMLLAQANKDFREMYLSQQQFEKTRNADYLRYIRARSEQMLRDNKVLSDKAKREIAQLQAYAAKNLKQENPQ